MIRRPHTLLFEQQGFIAHCFTLHNVFKMHFICTVDTKELVSWMRGHDSSISSISVHGSGRYAVTTSTDTAQLWDLDTFQRKRKLNVRQSVGIQKVSKELLVKGNKCTWECTHVVQASSTSFFYRLWMYLLLLSKSEIHLASKLYKSSNYEAFWFRGTELELGVRSPWFTYWLILKASHLTYLSLAFAALK